MNYLERAIADGHAKLTGEDISQARTSWVMTEIRKAREVEKKENRRKLFPIRLTDFETLRDWTCFDAEWIWHGSARVFQPRLFQLERPRRL